jgi:hypothetical protein
VKCQRLLKRFDPSRISEKRLVSRMNAYIRDDSFVPNRPQYRSVVGSPCRTIEYRQNLRRESS